MTPKNSNRVVLYAGAAALVMICGGKIHASDGTDTDRQLQELRQQNQALQEQLRQQQKLIESLSRKVEDIEKSDAQINSSPSSSEPEPAAAAQLPKSSGGFSFNKVNLSGEGGVAFFHSGPDGLYPNSEFRVDDARLFVEAPIWGDTYFFGELDLMTHEAFDLSVQLGELYLDVENISQLWNCDRMLNLRAGRMYIPFGEEYQRRYAIDNPLVSDSLSDIWGVDEGIELYGRVEQFSYAMAVQNGGASGVRDFSADKSIAGRIGFDPSSWLHLSVSAMRTGQLKPPGDEWSALWFANGWFVPLDPANVTDFHVNLFEGDIDLSLPHGSIKAFGGCARYDDNDPTANNRRNIYYYSIEGVQDITRKLYGAVRFSQILVDNGYPLAGNGNPNDYFFSGTLTEDLWRLTLGLGYRWSPNLVTKAEYSFEHGKEVGGVARDQENLFAVEAAFRF